MDREAWGATVTKSHEELDMAEQPTVSLSLEDELGPQGGTVHSM